jgi:hypothetical protein
MECIVQLTHACIQPLSIFICTACNDREVSRSCLIRELLLCTFYSLQISKSLTCLMTSGYRSLGNACHRLHVPKRCPRVVSPLRLPPQRDMNRGACIPHSSPVTIRHGRSDQVRSIHLCCAFNIPLSVVKVSIAPSASPNLVLFPYKQTTEKVEQDLCDLQSI